MTIAHCLDCSHRLTVSHVSNVAAVRRPIMPALYWRHCRRMRIVTMREEPDRLIFDIPSKLEQRTAVFEFKDVPLPQ